LAFVCSSSFSFSATSFSPLLPLLSPSPVFSSISFLRSAPHVAGDLAVLDAHGAIAVGGDERHDGRIDVERLNVGRTLRTAEGSCDARAKMRVEDIRDESNNRMTGRGS